MSSNSYSLVEAMVFQFINKIKNDPERNIRNSVDMALNFSKGRFQREFCYDSLYIDNIISDGPCAAVIDKNGRMYRMYDSDEKSVSCFSNGLEGALRMMFPK